MKRVSIIVGVWIAIFIAVSTWWSSYSTPTAIAERIAELDLPPEVKIVSFLDTYSMLFSSGITCGQLAIDAEGMNDLMKQARDKQYLPNLNSGLAGFYKVFQQAGCCQNLLIRLDQTPGRYKVLRKDRFETNYVVMDSLNRNVYFFRSVHDLAH